MIVSAVELAAGCPAVEVGDVDIDKGDRLEAHDELLGDESGDDEPAGDEEGTEQGTEEEPKGMTSVETEDVAVRINGVDDNHVGEDTGLDVLEETEVDDWMGEEVTIADEDGIGVGLGVTV